MEYDYGMTIPRDELRKRVHPRVANVFIIKYLAIIIGILEYDYRLEFLIDRREFCHPPLPKAE